MRLKRLTTKTLLVSLAAAAWSAAPASAASQFVLYGTFTGADAIDAQIYALSPHSEFLQWSVGTYSHSGGSFPGGGGVGGGGIDSVLTVSQGTNVMGSSDNLSATNKDSEIRTPNLTGRTGSVAIPNQSWASSFNVRLGPTNASSLGNGSSTLVSYQPGDDIQYLSRLTIPSTYTANAIAAERTYLYTRAGNPITLTGGVNVKGGGFELDTADFTADTADVEHASINIRNGATLRSRYLEFGSAQGDRGSIRIDGSGGMDIQQMYLAAMWEDAAINFEQNSGLVKASSISLDRPGSVNATSHYHLNGGKLQTRNISIHDGLLHINGGTLSMELAGSLAWNGLVGNKILWNSGGIELTAEIAVPVQTNNFFGGSYDLISGKSLSINAPGLSTFINLRGGKLALAGIADNGLRMDWQSGELEVTGSNALTVGVGKALGDQVALRQGMTLRVGGTLTTEVFSRIVLNDGAKLYAGSMTNNGELALQSTGASVNVTGTLSNWGIIRGSGRVSGTVTNQQNGRVELSEGDSFRLVGNFHNFGQFRTTGGDLLMSGFTFVNGTSGKLTGRGTLSAAAIDNRGIVTLSAGVSDVDTVSYTNRAGAKTIVTGAGNATFYGPVTNEAGSEFRISADSRATFLGAVTNLAAFTGTGIKIFDGPASGASLTTGGNTEVEPGGSLSVGTIREASFTIRGQAALTSNALVSKVNTLSLDGGTLDLQNSTLVVDYNNVSPVAAILASVAAGEVFSSKGDSRTAIAVAEAQDLGRTTVGDVQVDASSLVIALALQGDANIDGRVNFDDLLKLAQNYNGTARNWAHGDFSGDAAVNFDDLLTLAQNYNGSLLTDGTLATTATGNATFGSDFALALSLVPEPTSLLVVSSLAMVAGKRRRG